jgi:D-3-phosphoglycerate dehydrogenase
MLYTTNNDTPGIIGMLGTILGGAGVNIANFSLGRDAEGGHAIALLYLDEAIPGDVLEKVRALPQIEQARPLEFEV